MGYRLPLLARKNVYGEKELIISGPILTKIQLIDKKVHLGFEKIEEKLVAGKNTNTGSELKGFAIVGADKKFV